MVILTDNGSEFSDPLALEFDANGVRRARVFYCDPRQSQQKGAIEVNHEFIRRVIPKGAPMDGLTQADIDLMMANINSYRRDKLGGKSPIEAFSFFHGSLALAKLGIAPIPDDDITLLPRLLKR